MNIRPTDEQQGIVQARGRVVKINARAGTGKTTVLRMVAEQRPGARGLYLVFNKRAQLRAQEEFPANFAVRTVHSLAYGSCKRGARWRVQSGGSALTKATFLPAYMNVPDEQHELAGLSHAFLSFFMNVPCRRVEGAVSPFAEAVLTGEQRDLFQRHVGHIVDECRSLLASWYQGRLECPHDFYLKFAHHSGRLQKRLAQYDFLLVDEGQDLSEIMLDLLLGYRGRLFIVGDTHQGIYGFRHAVDAMHKLSADEEHELSLSFRFGQELAAVATMYIREAKGLRRFTIRGAEERATQVELCPDTQLLSVPGGGAVLARTNVSLFETALRLSEGGRPVRFEREVEPLLRRVQDSLWLYQGRRERIEDPFIAAFGSLVHMEEYAELMDDGYLRSLAGIVRRYGPELARALRNLREHCRRAAALSAEDVVTLSTVHSAKGQEYSAVLLHEDIPEYLEEARSGERGGADPSAEANVGYVAMTRAAHRLQLPTRYGELFSVRWQRLLGSLRRPQEALLRSSSNFSEGDRVRTRLGPGVVERVSGDGQQVQVLLIGAGMRVTERPGELVQEG